MISPRRFLRMALVMVATALAGCGAGTSDGAKTQTNAAETPIRQVVAQLGNLSRQGDGAAICNTLLTQDLEASIRRASKSGSCTSEVVRNLGSTKTQFTVRSVSIDKGAAVVRVTDQEGRASQLLMRQVGSTWKIARIS